MFTLLNYQYLFYIFTCLRFSDVFVSGVGPQFGLKVSLSIDEDQYVSPIKPYHGLEVTKRIFYLYKIINNNLKVAIHEPYQFPDMVFASTTLSPGYKIALPMDPTVFSSDEDIRVIGKKNRGCIFYDEVNINKTEVINTVVQFLELLSL